MKYKQVLTPFTKFLVTASKTTVETNPFHIVPKKSIAIAFIQRLRKKEMKVVYSLTEPGINQ
jgi:hypothetical protein